MRALGFEVKKAEVLKILRDHTENGTMIEYDDFFKLMTERILDRDPIGNFYLAYIDRGDQEGVCLIRRRWLGKDQFAKLKARC
jgi:hypothetical protein